MATSINQFNSVTAVSTPIPQASQLSGSRTPTNSPRLALQNDQGTITALTIASNKPPTFDLPDEIQWPRTKCENDVVMPQLGQGIPNMVWNEQGGSPSCW